MGSPKPLLFTNMYIPQIDPTGIINKAKETNFTPIPLADPEGGQGVRNPLENHKFLYVSLEILVYLGSNCFLREVRTALCQIC